MINEHGLRMRSQGRSFRDCVRDCARDARMVATFKALSGAKLEVPIAALLHHQQGEPGPDPDTEEGAQLGAFILFVYVSVWRHVKRAHQRMNWPTRATDLVSLGRADSSHEAVFSFDDLNLGFQSTSD